MMPSMTTPATAGGGSEPAVRCPNCGFVSHWDSFDVLGADYAHGFCPHCHKQCELHPNIVRTKPMEQGEMFEEAKA
jgi:hypothetical protein